MVISLSKETMPSFSDSVISEVSQHSHGEARVKLLRLDRRTTPGNPHISGAKQAQKHSLKRFDVQVRLEGGPSLNSFTGSDNTVCVATDSVKNSVFVLSQQNPLCSKEAFATIVGKHFCRKYPELVQKCEVLVEEDLWERVVYYTPAPPPAPPEPSKKSEAEEERGSNVPAEEGIPATKQLLAAAKMPALTTGVNFPVIKSGGAASPFLQTRAPLGGSSFAPVSMSAIGGSGGGLLKLDKPLCVQSPWTASAGGSLLKHGSGAQQHGANHATHTQAASEKSNKNFFLPSMAASEIEGASVTEHCHAFRKRGPEVMWCMVTVCGTGTSASVSLDSLVSGVRGLTMMKTTQSAWEKFVRDEFTTLPDAADRIMASSIDTEWSFYPGAVDGDFDTITSSIYATLVEVLCGPSDTGVFSPSVQRTVYEMGEEVLKRFADSVGRVKLYAPNLDHIPFDFSRLEDALGPNRMPKAGNPEVFVVTSEPAGIIQIELYAKEGAAKEKLTLPASQQPVSKVTKLASTSKAQSPATKEQYLQAPGRESMSTANTTTAISVLPTLPNVCSRRDFLDAFGGVYEKSIWICERAWPAFLHQLTYKSADDLLMHLRHIVTTSSYDEKLALLCAHPDLASKVAIATLAAAKANGNAVANGEHGLTKSSQIEQCSAGLDQCTRAEYDQFQVLNDAYHKKFGFPFILAVSGRSVAQILATFEDRVSNATDVEFEEALIQVHKIAEIRVQKILVGGL
ncbi:unnamed protein product [Amoebophrya sp. A25]|nr:unnamed protein product [Amoebophrya sp. A25]|eukprot:GSA25T00026040001.1